MITNCPHCGAGQEVGYIVKMRLCRRCGFGMTFDGKKYLPKGHLSVSEGYLPGRPGRFEKIGQASFAILSAVAIIIISTSIAHNTPGTTFSHTSAMFRTTPVARMAMTEQDKIWHSLFPK
ncbi:MAG: hypothetical protein A2V69_03630 [Candidatus Portnoybacteria bacterium RBG_13_40_8]|uniref:Uncharacterized protein n=1 Tax=Candidatus Portnoybacteria bacterium RBG_13_40_8 TaxID=1801990 RepID=A0A1G2F4S0_9BACT|nr:MAG: hypothetical protein A2V69_03630 [Candidatus Portnoybacteria bacterium RBG_13_40_8]